MNASIRKQLETLATATNLETWKPQEFDLGCRQDADTLAAILPSDVSLVHDTILQQVADLVETRHPEDKLDTAERRRRVAEHIRAEESRLYGKWFFYPWSRRLVHVLPEDEFRELRTSRNRNKITSDEQQVLRQQRIGVVGLSVGQSAAITLTLEEVGGFLHLADFDHLELSNLNRLRSGVHNLGLNKAVLCAREIFEINPYAHVAVFKQGVNEENLDEFLAHGPWGKLNLVIEECDDLQMKVMVRESARRLRIPVIMETSDRGLIDIERFDLEPGRPIFHGLVGHLNAADLKGLTTYQKVPVVAKILDMAGLSDRMAASMIDVETTLKSFPQLASEVAMGGGIDVDVVRRIALGQLKASGRFYVDLRQIVCDERAGALTAPPSLDIELSPEALRFDLPAVKRVKEVIRNEDIRTLVSYATTAFSGGNCQPWRFNWTDHTLRCIHDVQRSVTFLDFAHHASLLAFGSVAEVMEMVANAMGLQVALRFAPDPKDPTLIFEADLRPLPNTTPPVDPLVQQVPRRVTNRRLGKRVALTPQQIRTLEESAQARGARLQLLTSEESLVQMIEVVGRADMIRLMHPVMHEEMMREMRWNKREVEQTRDGIDVATLEMSPTDLAGMRLVSSWRVMKTVGTVGGGLGLLKPTKKAIHAASAMGLVTMSGENPEAFFRAGRAVQRVWLTATELGLAFQPMTPITFIFDRLIRGGGEGFEPTARDGLGKVRQHYLELFDVPAAHCEGMLFRIGVAPAPTARSLRRRVDDVLSFA